MSFTLPEKEVMLQRLYQINDVDHLREHFYPHIAKHAGTKKVPQGVVLMWELALHDYAVQTSPMIANVLRIQSSDFLTAVTGENETACREVLKAYEKTQELVFLLPPPCKMSLASVATVLSKP